MLVLFDELEHDLDVGRLLELGDVPRGESDEVGGHPAERRRVGSALELRLTVEEEGGRLTWQRKVGRRRS